MDQDLFWSIDLSPITSRQKVVGRDKDRKTTHQLPLWPRQSHLDEIYLLSIPEQDNICKTKIKPTFQPTPLLSRLYFTPDSSISFTQKVQYDGSCGQPITLCLWCSFFFMFFPCSSMGFTPQETVLYKLLQHVSFPCSSCSSSQTSEV